MKKDKYAADDPEELKPKIDSRYSLNHNNRELPPNTPKRYKSQQAMDTKTMIRKGGARGR
jgi:hypothetical protein